MDSTTSNALIAIARVARALTYLAYTFAIVTVVLLMLGCILELFGANPDAPFAEWLYRGLARAMAPFRGLFEPVPLDGRSVLDPSILFAMLVYGIVAFALGGLIGWLTRRILELRAGFTGRGRGTPQPLG
jgi:uncharacterized protein YggT (Ycf19 family)